MQICDLRIHDVAPKPFAHVRNEQFLSQPSYEQLRDSFPECPPSTGPTGHSLYWGDEHYDRLVENHASWRGLFETFHSQAFVDWGIAQFGEVWERHGCTIDLAKARYVPYREDRIDKERSALRKVEHAPHELWVRMDIHQGRVGYARQVHLDHARRLLTMLIYLCDLGESHIEGGELLLHARGWRRWIEQPTVVTPRDNLMVAFACTPDSWHSVAKIRSMTRPRNYIQVQISSSVDAWSGR